jgi:hypothetical protein
LIAYSNFKSLPFTNDLSRSLLNMLYLAASTLAIFSTALGAPVTAPTKTTTAPATTTSSASASATPSGVGAPSPGSFYLLATPTKPSATPPKNATGLDLFDPYYQAHYLLRANTDAGKYSPFTLTE